jgi:hypothetical protein
MDPIVVAPGRTWTVKVSLGHMHPRALKGVKLQGGSFRNLTLGGYKMCQCTLPPALNPGRERR